MNKLNRNLLVILAVQALLAAITWSALHVEPEVTKKNALFDFDAADISALKIEAMQGDKAQDPLSFKKEGDGWVIDSAEGFKATAESVEKITKILVGIKIERPIATKKANHTKLSVAKDAFDRRLTITAKGKDHVIYMGRGGRSSASVRRKGEAEVYEAAGVSVWDIMSRSVNYIETSYLEVPETDLTSVTVTNSKGTLNFVRRDGEWTIPGMEPATETGPDGQPVAVTPKPGTKVPDAVAIKSFVKKLAKINISDPVGKTTKPEYGLDNGTTVTLNGMKDGESFAHSYVIGEKDENSRYLKAKDNEFIVKGANYNFEPATQNTVDDFLKEVEEKKEESPAPAAPAAGQQIPPEVMQQLQQQGVQMPQ